MSELWRIIWIQVGLFVVTMSVGAAIEAWLVRRERRRGRAAEEGQK